MNLYFKPTIAIALSACALASACLEAEAARKAKLVENPDFTQGGVRDDFHDWNLGPTGLRGWIYGRKGHTGDARQMLVTAVAKNSSADGVFAAGDVIVGVRGKPFTDDARKQFAQAITEAEEPAQGGKLQLVRWRKGNIENVSLQLAVMGRYSDTAPYNCPKSEKILEQGCQAIAAKGLGHVSIPNNLNALALLASGRSEYRPLLAKYAKQVSEYKSSSYESWYYGYATLFLAEYVAATGDKSVMPGLRRLTLETAHGASWVGTYSHGFANPDGRASSYGAMNQPTLSLLMAMIVAREVGISDPDLDKTIAKSSRFMRYYVNKGAIPYGDHEPWFGHEDNGKCSAATVCFDLLGDRQATEFFAKMSLAAYNERERGHTGNFFNILWAMPAVARCGPIASGAYMKEQSWYYDLAREFDGSFGYQGSPQGEEEHNKYTRWDCTGAYLLAYALPLKSLYITGKQPCSMEPLNRVETQKVIAAGRDYFLDKEKNGSLYVGRDPGELIAGLSSWSPIVRGRSAKSLARSAGDYVPVLMKMLDSSNLNTRYGACQALAALKGKAAPAVDKLIELLDHEDSWLRGQACVALREIGPPARQAVPEMLKLAARSYPDDARQFTQRYVSYALFYQGGVSGSRGLLAKDLRGVDFELLRPAITNILKNPDGKTRGNIANVYKLLTLEQLVALMPQIYQATEVPAPSGIMFAGNIRASGLKLLAKHRIQEALPLCLEMTEIHKWGKRGRVEACMTAIGMYDPASIKTILPELKQLEKDIQNHREANTVLKKSGELLRELINQAEHATGEPQFVPLHEFLARHGESISFSAAEASNYVSDATIE